MKILQVCDRTGLSERTVRFYESEGLIRPATETRNERTYREYDEGDIEALTTIAVLRRAAFSLQEIRDMLRNPGRIPAILDDFRTRVQAEHENRGRVLRALEQLDAAQCKDAAALSQSLRQATERTELPQADVHPNFGRFDGISPEDREREYQAYREREEAPERIARDLKSSEAAWLESKRIDIRKPALLVLAGVAALLPFALQIARLVVNLSPEAVPSTDPTDPLGLLFLTTGTLAAWSAFIVAAFAFRRLKGVGAWPAVVAAMLLWIGEAAWRLVPALADMIPSGFLDSDLLLYTAAPTLLALLSLLLFLVETIRHRRAGFATLLATGIALAYDLLLSLGFLAFSFDRVPDVLASPMGFPPVSGVCLLLPVLLFAQSTARKPQPVLEAEGDVPGQEVYLANRESRTFDLTHPH